MKPGGLIRSKEKQKEKRKGTAAVEFALTLPFLVAMLLGVWDYGRLVDVNQILINATREAARQASTGQRSTAEVQQSVMNALARAGLSTAGVNVSLSNLTSATRSNPMTANQLDQFQLNVTLPSNNVRFLALDSLTGPATLQNTGHLGVDEGHSAHGSVVNPRE